MKPLPSGPSPLRPLYVYDQRDDPDEKGTPVNHSFERRGWHDNQGARPRSGRPNVIRLPRAKSPPNRRRADHVQENHNGRDFRVIRFVPAHFRRGGQVIDDGIRSPLPLQLTAWLRQTARELKFFPLGVAYQSPDDSSPLIPVMFPK